MLVSMIDIFTVMVTFLLMTAVFSRTVILELKLPPANAEFTPPPEDLPPARREKYDQSGRNSKVLVKKLK